MHPKLITAPAFDLFGKHVDSLTLHTYGVLLAIGMLVGLFIAGREARRAGLDAARVTDLAIYVLIAGLVGAKLLLLVVEWRHYKAYPGDMFSVIQSGGVFYGGLLAALPVAWWYARKWGLDGWRTADVLAPGVVVGQAIGRLGCLAAGCCHGRPASVPWAVTFHDVYASRTVGTPLDIAVHPAQVYESIAAFLILVVLLWLAPRKRFHGQVAVAYVALYSLARFAIESFRGDSTRGFVRFSETLSLSTSQVISIALLIGVTVVVPYLLRKQRIAPALS